jgi:hypothetical protein
MKENIQGIWFKSLFCNESEYRSLLLLPLINEKILQGKYVIIMDKIREFCFEIPVGTLSKCCPKMMNQLVENFLLSLINQLSRLRHCILCMCTCRSLYTNMLTDLVTYTLRPLLCPYFRSIKLFCWLNITVAEEKKIVIPHQIRIQKNIASKHFQIIIFKLFATPKHVKKHTKLMRSNTCNLDCVMYMYIMYTHGLHGRISQAGKGFTAILYL